MTVNHLLVKAKSPFLRPHLSSRLMNTCAIPPCQSTLALDTPQTTAGTCAEALFIWHGGQPPYALEITQAAPGSLTSLHQTAVATLQSTYYAWTAAAVPGSSLIVVVQDALHQTANAQYLAIVGNNGCLSPDAFASAPASQSDGVGGLPSAQSSFSSSSFFTPSPASTFRIPSASPIASSIAAPSSSFIASGPTRTTTTRPGLIASIAVLCTVAPLLFAAFLYRMRIRTRRANRQTILYQPAAFSEKDSPLPRTPQALDAPTGCVADAPSSIGSSKRVPPSYPDTKVSEPDVRLPAAAHIHLYPHAHAHAGSSQAGLSPAVLPFSSLYTYPAAGPQMRAVDGGVRLSGGSSYPVWDVEAGVLPPAYEDL